MNALTKLATKQHLTGQLIKEALLGRKALDAFREAAGMKGTVFRGAFRDAAEGKGSLKSIWGILANKPENMARYRAVSASKPLEARLDRLSDMAEDVAASRRRYHDTANRVQREAKQLLERGDSAGAQKRLSEEGAERAAELAKYLKGQHEIKQVGGAFKRDKEALRAALPPPVRPSGRKPPRPSLWQRFLNGNLIGP